MTDTADDVIARVRAALAQVKNGSRVVGIWRIEQALERRES